METSLNILVNKEGAHYIARGIEHAFIAQGDTVDEALECLIGCVIAQIEYDIQKKRTPFQSRIPARNALKRIFETAKVKYDVRLEDDAFGSKGSQVHATYAFA